MARTSSDLVLKAPGPEPYIQFGFLGLGVFGGWFRGLGGLGFGVWGLGFRVFGVRVFGFRALGSCAEFTGNSKHKTLNTEPATVPLTWLFRKCCCHCINPRFGCGAGQKREEVMDCVKLRWVYLTLRKPPKPSTPNNPKPPNPKS